MVYCFVGWFNGVIQGGWFESWNTAIGLDSLNVSGWIAGIHWFVEGLNTFRFNAWDS